MSWRDSAKDLFGDLADRMQQERIRMRRAFSPTDSTALSEFIRPNLGQTPPALRRVLEPIVAVSALLALAVLTTMGALGFAVLFAAASLIYLILTYVFGLRLDMAIPGASH